MKVCGFITRDNERIFIPKCISGAIHGYDKCTCNYKRKRADRIDQLERRIEKLEKLFFDNGKTFDKEKANS